MILQKFYLRAVLGIEYVFQKKVVQLGIASYLAYLLYVIESIDIDPSDLVVLNQGQSFLSSAYFLGVERTIGIGNHINIDKLFLFSKVHQAPRGQPYLLRSISLSFLTHCRSSVISHQSSVVSCQLPVISH